MKKLISISLVFCILLSIPVLTIAKENNQTDSSAVELLMTLGFIENDKFGNFPPDVNVTRGEFIAVAAKAAGISGQNKFEGIFSDVTAETTNSAIIEEMYNRGYISGDGEKRFRPDDYITFNEAVKILVSVLGYTPPAERAGGYPGGYRLIATRLEILDDVSSENYLTNKNMANLVKNTLDAPTFEVTSLSNDGYSADSTGKTLLSLHYDIEVIEGVFNADAYTSLTDESAGGSGSVKIAETVLSDGIGNTSDYLGYYVKAYYSESAQKLIYCEKVKNKNRITEFTDANEPEFSDGRLTYFDADGRNSRSVVIPSEAKVVYNGKLITTFNEDYYSVNNGTITLISNDGNDNTDVVIINEYTNFVVDMLDFSNRVLYVKNSSNRTVSLEGADMEFYDETGRQIDWSYITEWSVLSTLISDDGKLMKFYKSANLAQIEVSGVEDEYIYDTENNKYEVSEEYLQFYGEIKLGDKEVFLLDIFGKICGKHESENKGEVAYITGIDTGNFGNKLQIGIITENSPRDKKVIAADTANVIKIDGDKVKISEAAKRMQEFLDSDVEKICVLQYNDEGKISEIDTLLTGDNEDLENALCLDYDAQTDILYRDSTAGALFVGKSVLGSDFKVIYIPPYESGEKPDTNGIAVRNGYGALNSGDYYTNLQSYKLGKDNLVASYIVRHESASGRTGGSFDTYMRMSIVTKITGAYDERAGEVCKQITYYTNGETVTRFAEEEEIADELNPGDIALISVNSEGRIDNYRRKFNASTGKLEAQIDGEMYDEAKLDFVSRSMYGNVYKCRDGVVMITKYEPSQLRGIAIDNLEARGVAYDEAAIEAEIATLCEKHLLPESLGRFDKADGKAGSFYPSGEKEIRSYEEYGDNYSKVYFYSVYSRIRDGFIMENF